MITEREKKKKRTFLFILSPMEYKKIDSSVSGHETSVKKTMDDEPLLKRKSQDAARAKGANDARASISTRGSSEACVDDPVPHEFKTAFKKLIPLVETLDPPEKQWLDELTTLFDNSCVIFSYAHAYDFNGETPYNGFRSFNQMILAYFNCIIRVRCKMTLPNLSRRRRNKCVKKLMRFKSLIPPLMAQLALLNMVRERSHEMDTSDFCEEESIDRKILFALLDIKESTMIPMFTAGAMNLWLSKSQSRFLRRIYLPFIPLKLYSKSQAMRCLVSAELAARLYTDYALNCSLRELRKLWSMAQPVNCSGLVRRVGNVAGKFKVKTWYLHERQKKWLLDGEKGEMTYLADDEREQQVNEDEEDPGKSKAVKCKVIRLRSRRRLAKSRRASDADDGDKLVQSSLILFIHGGGFIAGTCKSYMHVLKSWVKTTCVPVVAIDYSLAPEHKYPIALQECLDVYLHLVSGGRGGGPVTGLLRPPQRIVITGDSAGGNLSIALAIAISEINRLASSLPSPSVPGVTMPMALCLQYPSVSACMGIFSPSRVLFDPILTPASRFLIAPAYSNNIDYYDDGKTSLGGNGTPWYRKNIVNTREVVEVTQQKLSDPFYHTLSYRYFSHLSQVKLYIQAAQFDPLLDDSVAIARHWTGEVVLDVVEKVCHGFLNFSPYSRDCKLATELTLRRVNQSLQLTE